MTKQEAKTLMNEWAVQAAEVLNKEGLLALEPGTKEYEEFKEAFLTLHGEEIEG